MQETERLIATVVEVISAHDVVISNGGTGWRRHLAEPLWELRQALTVYAKAQVNK
jgi:hypothetical protein